MINWEEFCRALISASARAPGRTRPVTGSLGNSSACLAAAEDDDDDDDDALLDDGPVPRILPSCEWPLRRRLFPELALVGRPMDRRRCASSPSESSSAFSSSSESFAAWANRLSSRSCRMRRRLRSATRAGSPSSPLDSGSEEYNASTSESSESSAHCRVPAELCALVRTFAFTLALGRFGEPPDSSVEDAESAPEARLRLDEDEDEDDGASGRPVRGVELILTALFARGASHSRARGRPTNR